MLQDVFHGAVEETRQEIGEEYRYIGDNCSSCRCHLSCRSVHYLFTQFYF